MNCQIMNVRKLVRLLDYTNDRSLLQRLRRWRAEQPPLRRERLWRKRTAAADRFAYKLERGATINLYRDDALSKLFFVEGFEEAERAFVRSYLIPGDIFVDVGANWGLFTLTGARHVGPQGKVYALEPCAKSYARLVDNVRRNQLQNVECAQIALSDKDEARLLITSLDGYDAWNSLAQPTAGRQFRSEPIQCVTWDVFAAQHGLTGRVALMKIDVEGWEFYMLQGAQATLCRTDAPDLLVEFTEVNANAAGVTGPLVYELLLAFGYTLYRIDAKQKAFYPAVEQSYEWENLLATKQIVRVCERTGYAYAKQ